MNANTASDRTNPDPSPEEVDRALEAYHGGSPEAFDRLLGEPLNGTPGVCTLLSQLFQAVVTGEFHASRTHGSEPDHLCSSAQRTTSAGSTYLHPFNESSPSAIG